MPRAEDIPDLPTSWKAPSADSGQNYDIELLTPMFGGGVETRVNDPTFPIRPTAIRGQLQFWWRATVGAQYPTKEKLREAQSEIWGSTEQASGVQVVVESVRADTPVPCAKFENDRNYPEKYRSMPTWNPPFNRSSLPYVLFPFQGQLAAGRRRIDVEPASCITGAKLRLVLRCHPKIDLAKDVEPAIWAWVSFGGIGSRTRRGCGSIRCNRLAPKDRHELINRLRAFLQHPSQVREWPTLGGRIFVGNEQRDAMAAWDLVIKLFRDFRQGVGVGRNPGQQPNRPGRSRFPEPETIRRVTGRRSGRHARLAHIPDDAFPRAELGLPIVFHFKDQDQGDPADTFLYPDNDKGDEKRERMASPLILKPLALENGKAVPLILQLKVPDLTGVDLRRKVEGQEQSVPFPNPMRIRDASLAGYTNSPLAGSPKGSAVHAFLAYAGFEEVTL